MNSTKLPAGSDEWVVVKGQVDRVLARSVGDTIDALRAAGRFTAEQQLHIQELSFSITGDRFASTPERVECLRRLCQVYSADVRPESPTSHRAIIGPFIVLAKKAIQPLVRWVFGPALRNQREFNAGVISLLTDLCNEDRAASTKPGYSPPF